MHQATQIIEPELLKLLVCPIDHAELELRQSTLVCSQCGRVFPITDGIPNMVAAD